MAIITETIFKDSKSGEIVEFVCCPCGNNVFHVTSKGDSICACCKLSGAEAKQEKEEAETLRLQRIEEAENANIG